MLARRLRDALRLGRSLLLLEDDGEGVDWEVDQDGPAQAEHPHRAPLQSRLAARRNGQGEPAVQPCLSPIRARPAGAADAGCTRRRSGARRDTRGMPCAQRAAHAASRLEPR